MLSNLIMSALRALPALALMGGLSATTAHAKTTDGCWRKACSRPVSRDVAPPYVMRDPATGEYSGFFAYLCKEFAGVLKVKPQLVDTTSIP